MTSKPSTTLTLDDLYFAATTEPFTLEEGETLLAIFDNGDGTAIVRTRSASGSTGPIDATIRPRPVVVPVYVAGNYTIHAGRKIGTYPNSKVERYVKLCGSSRSERHDPSPVGDDAEITCKRCLAKIAKRDEQAARKVELDREDFPQLPERKWTVEVSVAGQDVSELVELTNDTLKDTTSAGVALAAQLIRDGYGSDASVVLYKQLSRDPEPVRDRSVYVYRDFDGTIRTQR